MNANANANANVPGSHPRQGFRLDATEARDRLPALGDFLVSLADAVWGEPEEAAGTDPASLPDTANLPFVAMPPVTLSELKVDLPFELDLLPDGEGRWQLDAAPPTQHLETSVMPVWHRVRLRVSVNDGDHDLEALEP